MKLVDIRGGSEACGRSRGKPQDEGWNLEVSAFSREKSADRIA